MTKTRRRSVLNRTGDQMIARLIIKNAMASMKYIAQQLVSPGRQRKRRRRKKKAGAQKETPAKK